jgi:hypothetical protein
VTRNTRLLIGIAAVAAVLGAFWFLILSPKRVQAGELETAIAAKNASIQQIEATGGEYAKQRDAYKSNYTTLVRLGKAVPTDDDVRSLMLQIDDAATRSGVDFRTISVGGTSNAPTVTAPGAAPLAPGSVSLGAGFSAMPFKFTFTGRFSNLGGFFSRLERFVTVQEDKVRVTGRLMRVESITLAPGQSGYPQIQATISASSYLASAAPSVSQGGAATTSPTVPATAPAPGGTTTTTTATATGALR